MIDVSGIPMNVDIAAPATSAANTAATASQSSKESGGGSFEAALAACVSEETAPTQAAGPDEPESAVPEGSPVLISDLLAAALAAAVQPVTPALPEASQTQAPATTSAGPQQGAVVVGEVITEQSLSEAEALTSTSATTVTAANGPTQDNSADTTANVVVAAATEKPADGAVIPVSAEKTTGHETFVAPETSSPAPVKSSGLTDTKQTTREVPVQATTGRSQSGAEATQPAASAATQTGAQVASATKKSGDSQVRADKADTVREAFFAAGEARSEVLRAGVRGQEAGERRQESGDGSKNGEGNPAGQTGATDTADPGFDILKFVKGPVVATQELGVTSQVGNGTNIADSGLGKLDSENAKATRVDLPAQSTSEIRLSDVAGKQTSGAQRTEARPSTDTQLQQKIIDQMVREVRLNRLPEQNELVVRLTPPELGSLRVQLTQSATGLTGQIMASTDSVRNLLQASLPMLMEALSTAGLKVDSVSVASNPTLSSFAHSSGFGAGQSGRHGETNQTPSAATSQDLFPDMAAIDANRSQDASHSWLA